jgi:hypothetical protein
VATLAILKFFFSENEKKREEFLEIFSPVFKIKILN